MDEFFAALEASSIAQTLRNSRWEYAAVSTAHVLGIALLVGAILPLDLRLLGWWRSVPLQALSRVLVPMAAAGLAIAVTAGALMFSIRAREYADLGLLRLKLALVALGILSALTLHLRAGARLESAGSVRRSVHAAISIACWLGALVCGRLIAFVSD